MPVEIRETSIEEADDATAVRLLVSDAPKDEEDASFRLDLLVTLPRYREPLLAQIQREAMKRAQDALNPILQKLANEISAHHPLEPDRNQIQKLGT